MKKAVRIIEGIVSIQYLSSLSLYVLTNNNKELITLHYILLFTLIVAAAVQLFATTKNNLITRYYTSIIVTVVSIFIMIQLIQICAFSLAFLLFFNSILSIYCALHTNVVMLKQKNNGNFNNVSIRDNINSVNNRHSNRYYSTEKDRSRGDQRV